MSTLLIVCPHHHHSHTHSITKVLSESRRRSATRKKKIFLSLRYGQKRFKKLQSLFDNAPNYYLVGCVIQIMMCWFFPNMNEFFRFVEKTLHFRKSFCSRNTLEPPKCVLWIWKESTTFIAFPFLRLSNSRSTNTLVVYLGHFMWYFKKIISILLLILLLHFT